MKKSHSSPESVNPISNIESDRIEVIDSSDIEINQSAEQIVQDELYKNSIIKTFSYLYGRDLTYKGKILKRAFGTKNMPEEQSERFYVLLDRLVQRDILVSKHQKYAFKENAPLSSLDLDELLSDEDVTEIDINDESITLSGLEVEILKSFTFGEMLRLEELKKRTLQINNMGNEEYSVFKKQFPEFRRRIASFLTSKGLESEWTESGRNRGKKYQLHTKNM